MESAQLVIITIYSGTDRQNTLYIVAIEWFVLLHNYALYFRYDIQLIFLV